MNFTTLFSTMSRTKPAALGLLVLAALLPGQAHRTPDLPAGSEALAVPAGHTVAFRTFAAGVQIYRCDPTTLRWTFVAPYALLYANARHDAVVGVHFGGPTWVTASGSTVVGRAIAASIVDPTAIPWLLIEAIESEGPGVLAATTFVQRVHTAGGLPPARVGDPGEIALVPYTAMYFFYRAR